AEVLCNPGAIVEGVYSLRAIVLAAVGAMTLPGETHDAVHALPFFWRHCGADGHAVASPDDLVDNSMPPLAALRCDPNRCSDRHVRPLHLSAPVPVAELNRRGLQNHSPRLPSASSSGFIILCTCAHVNTSAEKFSRSKGLVANEGRGRRGRRIKSSQ